MLGTLVLRLCASKKFHDGCVLASPGYSKRIAQTEWVINSRNLFLTVLESMSPRSRCWQTWCLARASWFIDSCLFAVTSHGKRFRGVFQGLFYKGTNLICDTITSLKLCLLTPSCWASELQHANLGGFTNIYTKCLSIQFIEQGQGMEARVHLTCYLPDPSHLGHMYMALVDTVSNKTKTDLIHANFSCITYKDILNSIGRSSYLSISCF